MTTSVHVPAIADQTQAYDPFGMLVNPADLLPWPPQDEAELARLDAWTSEMEADAAHRE